MLCKRMSQAGEVPLRRGGVVGLFGGADGGDYKSFHRYVNFHKNNFATLSDSAKAVATARRVSPICTYLGVTRKNCRTETESDPPSRKYQSPSSGIAASQKSHPVLSHFDLF
jgi:hypothetical protein